MGTKHAARSPAKGEDEFQELLLMTRQALFKGIQKELDHYRVTQFQDGKSGGLHLTEDGGGGPGRRDRICPHFLCVSSVANYLASRHDEVWATQSTSA